MKRIRFQRAVCILCLALVVALSFALTACGGKPEQQEQTNPLSVGRVYQDQWGNVYADLEGTLAEQNRAEISIDGGETWDYYGVPIAYLPEYSENMFVGKPTSVGAVLRLTVRMSESEEYFASPKSEEVVYTVKEVSAQLGRELVGVLPKNTPLSGNLPDPGSYNPFVYTPTDGSATPYPYMAYLVGEVHDMIQVKIERLTLTETTYEIGSRVYGDEMEYAVLTQAQSASINTSVVWDDVWNALPSSQITMYMSQQGIWVPSDRAITIYDTENPEQVAFRTLVVIVRLRETDMRCHSEGIKIGVDLL